jgi:hypothetical protein
MANAATLDLSKEPQSVIIYGPSLSGKTLLATSVAKKFKVLYIDGENGTPVIFQHPKEWLKNIEVQKVVDNKDQPNFIRTGLKLASGALTTVCDEHGIVMNGAPVIPPCPLCKPVVARRGLEPVVEEENAPVINPWKLSALDPNEWIVIFDSFTQLSSSANAYVTSGLKGDLEFEEFKHWRAQGNLLEKFLDYMQTARYNCIVISHEELVKQEDGTDKIVPAGGTSNFARKVTRYFNSAIYCTTKNKKHVVMSATTDDTRVIAGTRDGLKIDISTPETRADSMCALFGK